MQPFRGLRKVWVCCGPFDLWVRWQGYSVASYVKVRWTTRWKAICFLGKGEAFITEEWSDFLNLS